MIDFSHSAVSLIPPAVALGMTVLTRRVLVSLGLGILVGALLLSDFSISATFTYLIEQITQLFYSTDPKTQSIEINMWNMSIVIFLVLLGMITTLLTLSGGAKAFAQWAQTKIKSPRQAKLLSVFIGIFIFIDDYFNSLAVGAIARPITDKFNISRAKLAYILDSTAAPICILMPISSWGAYIITLIGSILVAHDVTEISQLSAFVQMVPMNFYAIFAILMVICVASFNIDIGPMREHENKSKKIHGYDVDDEAVESGKELDDGIQVEESDNGKIYDLIVPILTLIVVTIIAMLVTGYNNSAIKENLSIFSLLENTDVGLSLDFGGIAGLIAALYSPIRQKIASNKIMHALACGAKSMLGSILILFFAWAICSVIGDINTGAYLSNLLKEYSFNVQFLPTLLFLTAFVMAFATGTSWGTFGIMLPIAGDMAHTADIAMLLPILASVLAGSVCGDHCSPISDTTILSSTGARCHHIDHVTTQLPYTLIVAMISCFGYLVLGLTNSVAMGFVACSVAFVVSIFIMKKLNERACSKSA